GRFGRSWGRAARSSRLCAASDTRPMRSLRERLGVAIGVTAVLSVFLTGIVAIGLLRRYSESTARSDLAKVARAIAAEDPDTVGTTVTLPLIRRVLAST